jgi:hypothetical protein
MRRAKGITRRQLLAGVAAASGAVMLPGAWVSALAQDPVVDAVRKNGRSVSREKVPWKVQPFPLGQVRLRTGPFQKMMEINRRYIDSLPNDRLLHTFRLTAGLPTSAAPLGGWEAPDIELRGHLVGGHYLSACALMYASSGDDDLKKRADQLVEELARCQKANGNGYLSAFPTEFFDRLHNGVKVWAPFYTMHKIMAGQLDMYVYTGNEQALANVEGMAGWVGDYLKPIPDDQWAKMQLEEHGGMNETLFNLYAVTGKEEYLALARRFDHKAFFEPLSQHRDELKGLHTNTNIPKVIGAARGYELTGSPYYHEIANYFWNEITSQRAYCTGGTSNGEHWNTGPGKLADELGTSAEECCCSYNMMKLTRHLYGWTADPKTMDYYERVMFNARLGTQDPDGMLMYYLPLAPGAWKTFGTAQDSFWCCTGTGIEEYSKATDTIYFHDDRGIYVNLFIGSEVNWPEKGIRLTQDTAFPEEEGTTLTVQAEKPTELALHIRVPYWAANGATVTLNGAPHAIHATPSTYITLNRQWKTGDKVGVHLPMSLHTAPLPDDHTLQAAMYGPLVLAGRLGNEGLTQEMIYGRYGPRMKPGPSPEIKSSGKTSVDWMEPAGGKLAFRTAGQPQATQAVPLYQMLGEKYVVYWKVTGGTA